MLRAAWDSRWRHYSAKYELLNDVDEIAQVINQKGRSHKSHRIGWCITFVTKTKCSDNLVSVARLNLFLSPNDNLKNFKDDQSDVSLQQSWKASALQVLYLVFGNGTAANYQRNIPSRLQKRWRRLQFFGWVVRAWNRPIGCDLMTA